MKTLIFLLLISVSLYAQTKQQYLQQQDIVGANQSNQRTYSIEQQYFVNPDTNLAGWYNVVVPGNTYQFSGAGVKVAIIDTGVNYYSSTLKNNISYQYYNYPQWDQRNWAPGINYSAENVYPLDDHGHGTHVAGIIKLIAPEVKMMVYKVFDKDGNTTNSTIRQAIRDAAKNGAQIINLSLGGLTDNAGAKIWDDLLDPNSAFLKNVTLVISSGNYFKNNDFEQYYPANVKSHNAITVCASDKNNKLASFSHYGKEQVDICAFGVDVLSLDINGESFTAKSGTSMSAPFITGTLALLKQANPGLNPAQLKWILYQSAKKFTDLAITANTTAGGVLDVNAALNMVFNSFYSIQERRIRKMEYQPSRNPKL